MTDAQIASELRPAPEGSETQRFNWRHCWYPIAFMQDLPQGQPYGFEVYGEPYVLFQDEGDRWICLRDRCPHRAAKLSDGQVLEGRLECLYHGWQFGEQGHCLHIPQLDANATVPRTAKTDVYPIRISQGMLWLWPGDAESASQSDPPQTPDLDDPTVFMVDTLTDLPYDQNLLVENLLDPAHVYISHDRTELGIQRESAQPLEFELLGMDEDGFQGRFRGTKNLNSPWTSLDFIAPNIVLYQFTNQNMGVIGGLALHALPTQPGKCRILVRRYGNIFKPAFRRKPRWLEHLRQNKILEEDLDFIVAQQHHLAKTGQSIQSTYLPLKSLDSFVIVHRKWLDQYGESLPWYTGYLTQKLPPIITIEQTNTLATRFERHTQHCSSCQSIYRQLKMAMKIGGYGAIASLALAVFLDGWWQVAGVLTFVGLAFGVTQAMQLKSHFESTDRRQV